MIEGKNGKSEAIMKQQWWRNRAMTNGMGWCIRLEGHTIAISVDESSLVLYIKLHICLIGLRDIGASRGSCKDDGNAQSKQDDSLHFFFFSLFFSQTKKRNNSRGFYLFQMLKSLSCLVILKKSQPFSSNPTCYISKFSMRGGERYTSKLCARVGKEVLIIICQGISVYRISKKFKLTCEVCRVEQWYLELSIWCEDGKASG